MGLLLAAHAAVQEQERFRASMITQDLIGVAKGILIERHRVTGDRAFTLVVRASQDTDRKLRGVADDLVDSGRLPQRPPPSADRCSPEPSPGTERRSVRTVERGRTA